MLLPSHIFVRVQKSCVINVQKLLRIEDGFAVMQSGAEGAPEQRIKIGPKYRDNLLQRFNQL